MGHPYRIRPALIEDADDYVRTHIELTNVTYAHRAPPEFARNRRADHDRRIEEFVNELREAAEASAVGREPGRQHWVAVNPLGTIVGVASAGVGIEPWEAEHLGEAWTPPATDRVLSHLYLAPGTHGSGLAQDMLARALPGGRPAYLWAFDDNRRAAAFYRKNGFTPDGLHGSSGEYWGDMPMSRWSRGRFLGGAERG
jgi:ribosomal protein S18 acetylase RimI-like enzyme